MIALGALRQGLGDSVASIAGLNHLGFTPDIVSPPCWFPAEITVDRTASSHRTFGATRGYDCTCRVLTSRSDDLTGQAMLDGYLSEGSSANIVDAVMADQTLGGIAKSVEVYRVDGYRLYTVGADTFYGATFHIQVLG